MFDRKLILRFAAAILAAIPLAVAACSDDEEANDGDSSESNACIDIIEACHKKDPGLPGKVNDCHSVGHTGETAPCETRRAECVDLCNAAPYAPGQDAGEYEYDGHSPADSGAHGQ